MKRPRFVGGVRLLAAAAVVSIVAVACGGGGSGTSSSSSSVPPKKGGTLQLATNQDVFTHWDPQQEYFQESFAFFQCCLLRTLMTYNGKPASQGGNQVYPDLATQNPTVSSDGLTWTFHMKSGLHYSPPLQSVEITSPDIVRALMRIGDPNVPSGYPFYYDVIQGFSDYSAGKAKTISGLSTPDPHTLIVTLTQPTGDLGYRFAMPATAPIPPNPSDPSAPLGVAQGHDTNYGSYMVSSGPYMWAGSGDLDFSKTPSAQPTLPGLQAGKEWTMVRNPSDTQDPLRPAYVDGIDTSVSPSASQAVLEKEVTAGTIDNVIENGVLPATLRQYQTTPNLKSHLFINPSAGNYYVAMNLGTPPFDDIHVRKAVEYAIDKAAIQRIQGGPIAWPIATHWVPNSLLTLSNGVQVLKNYDPYKTPSEQGADTSGGLQLAKAEMAQSKYGDSSGMCTASACKNVLTLGGNTGTQPAFNSEIQQNLAKIGIQLNLKQLNGSAIYAKLLDPSSQIPLALSPGWLQDYPDAFTFFYLTMYGPNISAQANYNESMVGATPAMMKKFGYSITSVPSMDAQIQKCMPLTGDARINCWADADKYLMEQIAAVVPLNFTNTVNITGPRVTNYVYNEFASGMSMDKIALNGGTSSSPSG
ncbi:MAG TPA: ABC transporter substrate-binding protein [Actinomycetota bacterium]|nr:ABC transporter substrate-binding protein [Actinomycetota bacterium]